MVEWPRIRVPELSDVVRDAPVNIATAKPEDIPAYVTELAQDLELLLDVGHALRSVTQNEMETWLEGKNRAIPPKHPHPGKVQLVGQPVFGQVREYVVRAPSGTQYSFVIELRRLGWIDSHIVKVKYTKTYKEGENPDRGILIDSTDHSVLYLLPLIARLPLEKITPRAVNDFLERHNGFKHDVMRPEMCRYQDVYEQMRSDDSGAKPIHLENPWNSPTPTFYKKFNPYVKMPVKMDTFVTVHNDQKPSGNEVRIELEVAIPTKKLW